METNLASDPIFDPLRAKLNTELKKYIIGRTLGECPRTGKQIDVRSAVWILDPEGAPHMGMHPTGWAEVLDDSEVVPGLLAAGISVDPSSIRDKALRQRSIDLGFAPGPAETTPAQTETLF